MPRNGNTADLTARIMERMTVTACGYLTACWLSDRAAQPNGYTKIGVRGRTWLTHRLAYEVMVGPIPDGLVIDHLCRQRACVNPDHLEPVTNRENLLRGETLTAAEAATTHCPQGHPYTPENTYLRPDRPMGRCCRMCRQESGRRRNAKLKAERRSRQ